MGEPLATLPPIVPALRTGSDAKRRPTSRRLGHSTANAAHAASSVAAAPMVMAVSVTVMACSSATLPM